MLPLLDLFDALALYIAPGPATVTQEPEGAGPDARGMGSAERKVPF